MSETISLDWIGSTLRAIQAEQRSILDESHLIRSAVSEMAHVLLARIAAFEALVDTRINVVGVRLDGLNGRFDRLEELIRGLREAPRA